METLYFIGCVKDAATLRRLIEDCNEDYDQNPFSKLMGLDYIDLDFTDYEYFGEPMPVDALEKAAESLRLTTGKKRFSPETLKGFLAALKLADETAIKVNSVVFCNNDYSPWKLTPLKSIQRGKTGLCS